MALVTIISFGIVDGSGGTRKTFPIYVADGLTDSDIQAFITHIAPDLDACIDGQIVDVSVTKAFTLPIGLKSSPVAGSDAQRGALLTFDAEDTNYNHSYWVPTWEDAGFTGDTVLNTGVYATLIQDLVAGPDSGADPDPRDRMGNDLQAYVAGRKTFRK